MSISAKFEEKIIISCQNREPSIVIVIIFCMQISMLQGEWKEILNHTSGWDGYLMAILIMIILSFTNKKVDKLPRPKEQ